ncbi:MAG: hypothetical protein H0W14_00060 [Actinobacteria bacterium]|nr:hypothetical protein [Actinomycetota bacterium]
MERRNSIRQLVAVAVVATGLSLFAGSVSARPDTSVGGKPRAVEQLRLAGGAWGYPSPFAYVRGPGLAHVNFLFDTLLWKDASGKPIPWLAEKWERSPDGLQWHFKLRKGIRWHDGRPLTARDVAFTFDYLRTGAGRTATGIVGSVEFIADVKAVSASTVVMRLASRFAPFPITIAGRVPIIPEHIWRDVSDPVKYRDPKALIGSGPYRLTGYDEASGSYRYAANREYFLGVPVVRSLVFVPAPDPLLALRRGEIDVAGLPTEEGVPTGALEPFSNGKFGRISAPGEWHRALHFNMTRGFPYNERQFRQGVAHAINRFGLVRRLLFGRGRPGSLGILAPSSPFAAEDLPTYPYSQATARRLLDAVGLRDRDGDGMRDLASGQAFTPELQTSARFAPETAELIQQDLRAVGLDVRIRSLDTTGADAAAAAGRYEMALIGYGGLGGEPDTLRGMLSAASRSRSFTRVHGYSSPRFEELAAAQLVTVRASTRKRQIIEMQQVVAGDVPVISLYVPTRTEIFVKNGFNAWYYTPGGVFGGYPGPLNKHAFVMGKKTGF